MGSSYGNINFSGFIFTSLIFFLINFHTNYHLASSANDRYTYIVYMDKSQMPKVFTTHDQWYSYIIDYINATHRNTSDSSPTLLYAYDNALHGFSASLSPPEQETLKVRGFVSLYPDKLVSLDTTHTPEFLSLNPSQGLWPTSSYGEDVVVGVIDSGVWPESRRFNDTNMTRVSPTSWKGSCDHEDSYICNFKIVGAKYFNRGAKATHPGINGMYMKSARDIIGQGMQTSSIIAGIVFRVCQWNGEKNCTARQTGHLQGLLGCGTLFLRRSSSYGPSDRRRCRCYFDLYGH